MRRPRPLAFQHVIPWREVEGRGATGAAASTSMVAYAAAAARRANVVEAFRTKSHEGLAQLVRGSEPAN